MRLRTRLDGVVTVVDAAHFLTQLGRRRSDGAVNESAQQIAFADTILLNKIDAVEASVVQEVEAEIEAMNPVCRTLRCSLSSRPQDVPLDDLLGREAFSLDRILAEMEAETEREEQCPPVKLRRLAGGTPKFMRPQSRHDTAVTSCAFTLEGAPLVLERFMQVMNTIRAESAMDLYRYKGMVCIKEKSGVMKRAVLQGIH